MLSLLVNIEQRPSQGAVRSREHPLSTPLYRLTYRLTAWLYPLLHRIAPKHTTTIEHLGRAMLAVTRQPVHQRVLFSPDRSPGRLNRAASGVGLYGQPNELGHQAGAEVGAECLFGVGDAHLCAHRRDDVGGSGVGPQPGGDDENGSCELLRLGGGQCRERCGGDIREPVGVPRVMSAGPKGFVAESYVDDDHPVTTRKGHAF